jgi:hypothetical protein
LLFAERQSDGERFLGHADVGSGAAVAGLAAAPPPNSQRRERWVYVTGLNQRLIFCCFSDPPHAVRRLPEGEFRRVPLPLPEVPPLHPVPGLLLEGAGDGAARAGPPGQGVLVFRAYYRRRRRRRC